VSFISRNHPQQVGTRGPLDEVDDRGTPPEVFGPLHARYRFTVDAAAAAHNARVQRFWTRADDGLVQSWAGERVWCNPPYSGLDKWVAKANHEMSTVQPAELIVMLLPANRTEQAWWQDHIEPYRDGRHPQGPRTEFWRGRTRFIKPGQTEIKPNERPPFGCVLCVWGDHARP
jgi:phage N-6-adenine-methyltransferase